MNLGHGLSYEKRQTDATEDAEALMQHLQFQCCKGKRDYVCIELKSFTTSLTGSMSNEWFQSAKLPFKTHTYFTINCVIKSTLCPN